MFVASLIRSSWIVSAALLETTREWPRLGSAAQVLIASTPVVAVALLAVLMIEPGAATAVGAWLSVAAVWGTG
ncbi:MAG: hypothetical protein KAR73_11520, partial [Spirochaetales bacterium]|nr:hypothetical protein [Spirochaetales bacterium]